MWTRPRRGPPQGVVQIDSYTYIEMRWTGPIFTSGTLPDKVLCGRCGFPMRPKGGAWFCPNCDMRGVEE